jgi:hypothetical protein
MLGLIVDRLKIIDYQERSQFQFNVVLIESID